MVGARPGNPFRKRIPLRDPLDGVAECHDWLMKTGRSSMAAQLARNGLGDVVPYRVIYEAYMASPAWAARKVTFFGRHGRRCAACGGHEDVQLHHRSYERFTCELDDDLRPLCLTCHAWVHHLERTSGLRLAVATDAVIEQGRSAPSARASRREPAAVGRQRSSMEVYSSGFGRDSAPGERGSVAEGRRFC